MTTESASRATRVLTTSIELNTAFDRCSREYSRLHLAVAWCGSPDAAPIFKSLKRVSGELTATIGVAFSHTHPTAIDWFLRSEADIRVFRGDEILFHPKVYLFSDADRYAAFVGSSNLTRGGFYGNIEVNTLIEGSFDNQTDADIRELLDALKLWHSPAQSFEPTADWLAAYREQFEAVKSKSQSVDVDTPPNHEDTAWSAVWLGKDDWKAYYQRVLEGLRQSGRTADGYHDVLNQAAEKLPLPWATPYFEDIEKRRIMGGITRYGWLGHVSASGMFRKLLANGSPEQHQTIAEVINKVANWNSPIPWADMETELNRLMALGFKMNVWGRFLALVRPDLYCTVAADTLRHNLADALNVSPDDFFHPAGYIELLKLLHLSPWYQSVEPTNDTERAIWQRRVAFMDPIFY